MVKEQVLTVSLEEFGLSKYEAQAYVALISKGTISASELAYYSEIPRTKIYPTLLKLENKKLSQLKKDINMFEVVEINQNIDRELFLVKQEMRL